MINTLYRIKKFINIFLIRIIYTFDFKEYWKWEYETCNNCGSCYRLPVGWIDEIWIIVNGQRNGCLCLDCFIQIAQKKEVKLSFSDIERMWIFDPDLKIGGHIDIIKPTMIHNRKIKKNVKL